MLIKGRSMNKLFLFQSAPAIAGGRCIQADDLSPYTHHVSIRARHCWRAMRSLRIVIFNRLFVSIRARHCWRAMRRMPQHPAY